MCSCTSEFIHEDGVLLCKDCGKLQGRFLSLDVFPFQQSFYKRLKVYTRTKRFRILLRNLRGHQSVEFDIIGSISTTPGPYSYRKLVKILKRLRLSYMYPKIPSILVQLGEHIPRLSLREESILIQKFNSFEHWFQHKYFNILGQRMSFIFLLPELLKINGFERILPLCKVPSKIIVRKNTAIFNEFSGFNKNNQPNYTSAP